MYTTNLYFHCTKWGGNFIIALSRKNLSRIAPGVKDVIEDDYVALDDSGNVVVDGYNGEGKIRITTDTFPKQTLYEMRGVMFNLCASDTNAHLFPIPPRKTSEEVKVFMLL